VFDVQGRRVAILAKGESTAGEHSVAWDGRVARGTRAAPGRYLVRLSHDGKTRVLKTALLE